MKRTLLLVFVLVFSTATSQEQDLLKGQIITDSIETSSINIVNLQREIGTTNTSSGSFEIRAGYGKFEGNLQKQSFRDSEL